MEVRCGEVLNRGEDATVKYKPTNVFNEICSHNPTNYGLKFFDIFCSNGILVVFK